MKTKTYGVSKITYSRYTCGLRLHPPSSLNEYFKHTIHTFDSSSEYYSPKDIAASREAVEEYRKNRENGSDIDNPSDEFPCDGTYSWDTADHITYLRYTEGNGDRAWMEEKDRNYLARLELEKALPEQEQRHLNWTSHEANADSNSPTNSQQFSI